MSGHRQQCNFFSGEACICRGAGRHRIGWEKEGEFYFLSPPPVTILDSHPHVDMPYTRDKALRVSCRVYYRLGEGN